MSTATLALIVTSARRDAVPLLMVVARPAMAWAPLGALYVIALPEQVAPATIGLASTGAPVSTLLTVRQRASMCAALPAAPAIRQTAAMVCWPGLSAITAVTARAS